MANVLYFLSLVFTPLEVLTKNEAVALGDVLGCASSPLRALKQIRQILRDDGVLVATFDNRLACIDYYLSGGDPRALARFLKDGKTHWLTKNADERLPLVTFSPGQVRKLVEGAGYEVRDLGTDVQPEIFVQAVKDGAEVVGLSALLTTTMVSIKGVLQALEEAGARDDVKVVIGGAPITQAFADEVGADGFAPNAASAVRLVQQITELGA